MARTKTHGNSNSKTYRSWQSMKKRCVSNSGKKRKEYGGRGITYCERWESFENFLADMGERPEGKTLDRTDVNGPYSPENCRWATPKEQVRNRRNTLRVNYNGKIIPLAELAENNGIKYSLAHQRFISGFSVSDILNGRGGC